MTISQRIESLEKQIAELRDDVNQASNMPADSEIELAVTILERVLRARFGFIGNGHAIVLYGDRSGHITKQYDLSELDENSTFSFRNYIPVLKGN